MPAGQLIVLVSLLYQCRADLEPQYAFAHRVNTKNEIAPVLAAGINAIEIDICYDTNTQLWRVSHYDFNVCNGETLQEWLSTLNESLINTEEYINQFAMLWLDIKTPGNENIAKLPDIVHNSELPAQIKILYDLVGFNTNGQNAFQAIRDSLNANEGISFCAGTRGSCGNSLTLVDDIYNFYQQQEFDRGTFNSGDSFTIDRNYLIKANEYKNIANDPYGFKAVFVWTTGTQTQMDDYMDPNVPYKTDGQIIGTWIRNWNTAQDQQYIVRFDDAIDKYADQVRLATSSDNAFQGLFKK